MFVHVDFWNDSNPYISLKESNLEKLFYKYELHIADLDGISKLYASGYNAVTPKTYQDRKSFWRSWAQNFAYESCDFAESWNVFAEWQGFAEYVARKYGLVTEFVENGII